MFFAGGSLGTEVLSRGFCWIPTAADTFSRSGIASPVDSTDRATLSRFIKTPFALCLFCCEHVVSNYGSRFTAQATHQWAKSEGTWWTLHALCHPQAAEVILCFYGQLKDRLKQFMGGDMTTPAWTKHLRQAARSLYSAIPISFFSFTLDVQSCCLLPSVVWSCLELAFWAPWGKLSWPAITFDPFIKDSKIWGTRMVLNNKGGMMM